MSKYFNVIIAFFSLVAVVHFLRLTFEWSLIIGDFMVPSWFSGLMIVSGILIVYWSLKLKKNS